MRTGNLLISPLSNSEKKFQKQSIAEQRSKKWSRCEEYIFTLDLTLVCIWGLFIGSGYNISSCRNARFCVSKGVIMRCYYRSYLK